MRKQTLASFAVVLATATAAHALTVTNKSDKEITISVDEGEKSKVVKIAAGKSATFKAECSTAAPSAARGTSPGSSIPANTLKQKANASPARRQKI